MISRFAQELSLACAWENAFQRIRRSADGKARRSLCELVYRLQTVALGAREELGRAESPASRKAFKG
jgi:hypothetical protein